jgi:hypothetical protein
LAPAEHFVGGGDQFDDFREQGIIGLGEDFLGCPRAGRIKGAVAFAKQPRLAGQVLLQHEGGRDMTVVPTLQRIQGGHRLAFRQQRA